MEVVVILFPLVVFVLELEEQEEDVLVVVVVVVLIALLVVLVMLVVLGEGFCLFWWSRFGDGVKNMERSMELEMTFSMVKFVIRWGLH